MTRIGSAGADINLAWDDNESVAKVALLVWDTNTLAWIKYSGAAGGGVASSVSVTSSALPAGAATAANQATEIASLASIDGKLGTLGQKAAAGSAPVVLASDQTLPLPSGASTAANQTSANTKLDSIITNTTGASTAANQTTANNSLASIDTKLSSQATAANQASELTKLDTLHSDLGTLDTDLKASQPRKLQDGSGNPVTSQANGTQRALDVGIDVGGVQVDPRQTRALTSADQVTVANPPSNYATETGGNLASAAAAITINRETQQAILLELRAIRLAMVALATDGSRYSPDDFNPQRSDFSDGASLN